MVLRLMGSWELTRGGRGHGETERWLDDGSKRGGVRRAQMRVRIHEVRESPVGCASRCEGKGGACLRAGCSLGSWVFWGEREQEIQRMTSCATCDDGLPFGALPVPTAPKYSPSPGAARPRAAEHVLPPSRLISLFVKGRGRIRQDLSALEKTMIKKRSHQNTNLKFTLNFKIFFHPSPGRRSP